MAKSYEMDMCNGPLTGKIIRFSIPAAVTRFIDLMFNTADMVVVGRFVGNDAFAAVGVSSPIASLVNLLFAGISVGAGVLTANDLGSGNKKAVSDTVHTSILFSIIVGIISVIIGLVFSKPILYALSTPSNIMADATLYMKIYFFGMFFTIVYQFGSQIICADGDTKHPLYYSLGSGALNLLLNVIFVVVFRMGIAGVAWATVISKAAAVMLLSSLMLKTNSSVKVTISKLRLHMGKLKNLLKIGVPSSLQGTVFAISSLAIQYAVNSFGSAGVAGTSAGMNYINFLYVIDGTIIVAASTFAGQNMGAEKYDRIKKIYGICTILNCSAMLLAGFLMTIFAKPLIGIYTTDATAIHYGVIYLKMLAIPRVLGAIMNTSVSIAKGMQHTLVPSIISIIFECFARMLWVFIVFEHYKTYESIQIGLPIIWFVTAIIQTWYTMNLIKRCSKK